MGFGRCNVSHVVTVETVVVRGFLLKSYFNVRNSVKDPHPSRTKMLSDI